MKVRTSAALRSVVTHVIAFALGLIFAFVVVRYHNPTTTTDVSDVVREFVLHGSGGYPAMLTQADINRLLPGAIMVRCEQRDWPIAGAHRVAWVWLHLPVGMDDATVCEKLGKADGAVGCSPMAPPAEDVNQP